MKQFAYQAGLVGIGWWGTWRWDCRFSIVDLGDMGQLRAREGQHRQVRALCPTFITSGARADWWQITNNMAAIQVRANWTVRRIAAQGLELVDPSHPTAVSRAYGTLRMRPMDDPAMNRWAIFIGPYGTNCEVRDEWRKTIKEGW